MLDFDIDSIMGEDNIVGDPMDSMENWHQQTYEDTCAIVSQEFVLEELTGQEFSEDQLRNEAIENGWYSEGEGTSLENMGQILELNGFDTELSSDNTIEDLSEKLENGEKIIVAVDSDEIWNSNDGAMDTFLNDVAGFSSDGGVDHAVEVIGIDYTDEDSPKVILNDPGSPDGMGMEVPMDVFEDAWEDGDNYMVSTDGSSVDDAEHQKTEDDKKIAHKKVGGYYNNDGTYHWESDNSNTDEKGNIVYWG